MAGRLAPRRGADRALGHALDPLRKLRLRLGRMGLIQPDSAQIASRGTRRAAMRVDKVFRV